MKEKTFQLDENDKKVVAARIKEGLSGRPDILFAYLHGSFVTSEKFGDIDVALFLDDTPLSSLDFELDLEAKLSGSFLLSFEGQGLH